MFQYVNSLTVPENKRYRQNPKRQIKSPENWKGADTYADGRTETLYLDGAAG